MLIENLQIHNFRLIEQAELEFDKRNIFIGDNAQGKTSILEAIYYLAYTKSFKGKYKTVVSFGSEFLKIQAKTNDNKLLLIETNSSIKLSKNNILISKRINYLGNLLVLLFSPSDLELIKAEPSARRRFINMTYGSLDNRYLNNLNMYNHILKERNILLKENEVDEIMLDLVTEQLVEYHQLIFVKRKEFISRLNILVKAIHANLSNGETLELVYVSIEDLKTKLIEKRAFDEMTHATNYGIHRDNLKFYLNGLDASVYASQGQIRTIMLSLNLALIDYVKEIKNEYPILLLDDVFSELDSNRIDKLFEELNKEIQVFITATDLKLVGDISLENTKIFTVESGNIKEEISYGKK